MAETLLWGGRFAAPPDALLRRFNDSFAFDRALLPEEIAASTAWARALEGAGVLTGPERSRIVRALQAIGREAGGKGKGEDDATAGGDVGRQDRLGTHEDVHAFVEAALRERVGPLAGKLHTGRSRNDQVATDLRLYLKAALEEAAGAALDLASVLAARGEEEAATPMPGYTHLKRAEPVTFGHWCLAYAEMLLRDAERMADARRRGDECPLGSAALSGTPLALDREALARDLGFARASANSLDAVSDRDTAGEYLFAGTLLLVHLSRLAEDLIFFSSDECGYATLPDSLSTGSSRMPQKRNPDLLELARGHAGRAIGELTGLLALMKGLPMAYDKDLQLDKEPVFRMRATLGAALPALRALLAGLRLDRKGMREAAADERLLATALADALAARGIPFRRAHALVGRRLLEAEAAGLDLRALGPGGGVTEEDLAALDLDRILARRCARGGTAPEQVRRAARHMRQRIRKLGRKP